MMTMDPVLSDFVSRSPLLEPCLPSVQAAYDLLSLTFRHEGKLLVCGNGGSAADSEHIAGELLKGYLLKRLLPLSMQQKLVDAVPETGAYLAATLQGALPVISLVSQAALQTAVANDQAADLIFAQQVYAYGRPGDALLVLSTSGRSKNVLLALDVASALEMTTIGLTGGDGGCLKDRCDVVVCVPERETQHIQEAHVAIYHAISAMLEKEFFPE